MCSRKSQYIPNLFKTSTQAVTPMKFTHLSPPFVLSAQVTLVTANDPGKAQPFFVAYGSHPDNTNPLVLNASTLVVRVSKHVGSHIWAVVTNPTGPAECFFKATADSCKI
jgi:hypothetical protein